eukprot:TRINITY_DN994_c0_g1_i1.p1 TRINITY_DN994_c0_g1~~TRINITY_DN994_c0_g1_i1.p1  ORF type:complete len:207 (+),score=28.47 TRINITY_DN994_c0_g1_i1:215-835(+)
MDALLLCHGLPSAVSWQSVSAETSRTTRCVSSLKSLPRAEVLQNSFQSSGSLNTRRNGPFERASYVGGRAVERRRRPQVQAGLKWVLEPAGDGDTAHLDEPVTHPGSVIVDFETAVVGRVADKSDIVIPVATVSGRHARLDRKGDKLYVTDLDSTNGTWIGGRQLRPGAVTEVSPGSFVTFGDEHLAQFVLLLLDEDEEVDTKAAA